MNRNDDVNSKKWKMNFVEQIGGYHSSELKVKKCSELNAIRWIIIGGRVKARSMTKLFTASFSFCQSLSHFLPFSCHPYVCASSWPPHHVPTPRLAPIRDQYPKPLLNRSQTALKLLWNCFKTAPKLLWNCLEIARKLLWNCVKTARKLLQNCSETARKLLWICSKTFLELLWNCSETTLKLLWNCVKTAPNLLLNCSETTLKLLWNCQKKNCSETTLKLL